jgi:diketogulonate reductase-like aldo/keto reductase
MPKDANGKMETAKIDYLDTWKAMEKLLETGKVKAIGVCNFNKAEIERIFKEGKVPPAMHQVEMHPWLQQTEFAEWHKAKGIHMTQYSPFGNLNQTYDAGKNLGKLTVRKHTAFFINDAVLMQCRKSLFSWRLARSMGKAAHKLPSLGVLLMAGVWCRRARLLSGLGIIWRETLSLRMRM